MTPLQYAVRTAIDSSTFSFRSPAVAEEVWTSIQAAPDAVCEEFLIVGEHVLRTCFLSLMLKREVAHPNGFLTTVKDAVLSPTSTLRLLRRPGFIGGARQHVLQQMHSDFPLDLLAQIKVIQFQWQVWNGSHATLPTSTSLQKARIPPDPLCLHALTLFQLIWSTSSFAGRELATLTGAAMAPVIRIAGTALRAQVHAPRLFHPRYPPNVPSRALLNSELDPCVSAAQDPCAKATEIPLPTRVFAPNSAPHISQATTTTLTSSLSASSNVRPWRYTGSAQMYAKEVSPAPALRLPPRASYSVRKVSWSEEHLWIPLASTLSEFIAIPLAQERHLPSRSLSKRRKNIFFGYQLISSTLAHRIVLQHHP
ncbi:hypothetical protein B0H13DRAFT_2570497 [Mycena leptocephala]|nr:hypothetical protein B0H13DRAFT_2570497 [Mycena leptocephala]